MVLGGTPEAKKLRLRLSCSLSECEVLECSAMAVPCSSTALLHSLSSPSRRRRLHQPASHHPALTSAVPDRSGAAVRVHPMLPNKRLPTHFGPWAGPWSGWTLPHCQLISFGALQFPFPITGPAPSAGWALCVPTARHWCRDCGT